MKKKDLTALSEKTESELLRLIDKRRSELYNSLAQIKSGNEKNLKKSKNIRHEISQLLTLIRLKQLTHKEEK
ncbi:50S ribosomal protein L29 [Candidatus Woesebacteria bacterium RIFCSPLOWO2_01_FULL_39_23]|uniref:Large ribosomal subunit protein uL29 n=3 Tax=Microgenomates group TaxID=1794810 RepID=A0A0H4TFV8_9BACT|nr:hypothetical protein [uncultured Microgenomates bacterium Rifle_16ft_4_minimus_37633]AKQ05542.1 hypothetical protein [uncultured Microgenomates bacterium Rifle_16ft_4_minimus_24053]OGM13882.1 MAG: 50S ribosomal protein L29 [Candidatus Woesebacteria bacterium RBG_16_40_11]OGM27834.1 MAG: 50S ribosomal protein L29 [Candidatus Woesebacteria bacterium RIFCSPHIGHO2_01_FULL_40_22]OGM36297.1 MAG: 50S ribosomal protein L29 [Candidatus Woesebacteria bacterium RIFCSPHIGHO2_12_FULL_38_9]OGM62256.1 MAG